MNVKKVVNLFAATILIAIGWISTSIARSYSTIISGQSAVIQFEEIHRWDGTMPATLVGDSSGIGMFLNSAE